MTRVEMAGQLNRLTRQWAEHGVPSEWIAKILGFEMVIGAVAQERPQAAMDEACDAMRATIAHMIAARLNPQQSADALIAQFFKLDLVDGGPT